MFVSHQEDNYIGKSIFTNVFDPTGFDVFEGGGIGEVTDEDETVGSLEVGGGEGTESGMVVGRGGCGLDLCEKDKNKTKTKQKVKKQKINKQKTKNKK